MSNTRSAVREMPRAKPNEAMVSTGWSRRRRSAGEARRAARRASSRSCRARCRRRCAAARSSRARARCRPRPGGRAPADGGAGSRRSGGSARRPRSRDRGFPGSTPVDRADDAQAERSASKPRLRASMPTAIGTLPASAGRRGRSRSSKATRQIVDAVPAHVLERVEHGRLARAGHAGDQQQARQGGLSRPSGCSPRRSSASATLDGADAVIASIADQRHGDAEHRPLAAVVGQALRCRWSARPSGDRDVVDRVHRRRSRSRGSRACRRWSAGAEAISRVAIAADHRLVVADQREAAVEQAQREVRLARPRRAGDQHRAAVHGDRAGMERFRRQAIASLRVMRGRPAGRRDGEAGARRRIVAVAARRSRRHGLRRSPGRSQGRAPNGGRNSRLRAGPSGSD